MALLLEQVQRSFRIIFVIFHFLTANFVFKQYESSQEFKIVMDARRIMVIEN